MGLQSTGFGCLSIPPLSLPIPITPLDVDAGSKQKKAPSGNKNNMRLREETLW